VEERQYRLRVGDWRVIYELRDGQMLVLVLKIGSRGSVYD
jgi:mRNA interferase RelE/StbE